jgi:hypothetical protein
MYVPIRHSFLVTAPKLNYFGTFLCVGCEQVVCMWPRHPMVNAFIYFNPSCFFSANDESSSHNVAIWAQLFLCLCRFSFVCTVCALLVKTSPPPHLGQGTDRDLQCLNAHSIFSLYEHIYTIYIYLAMFLRRFSRLEIVASVMCTTRA